MINPISKSTLEKMRKKSVAPKYMPAEPSKQGYKAETLQTAFVDYSLGDKDSLAEEINRVAREGTAAIEKSIKIALQYATVAISGGWVFDSGEAEYKKVILPSEHGGLPPLIGVIAEPDNVSIAKSITLRAEMDKSTNNIAVYSAKQFTGKLHIVNAVDASLFGTFSKRETYPTLAGFPAIGSSDTYYIDLSTGKTYYWNSTYNEYKENETAYINDRLVAIEASISEKVSYQDIITQLSVVQGAVFGDTDEKIPTEAAVKNFVIAYNQSNNPNYTGGETDTISNSVLNNVITSSVKDDSISLQKVSPDIRNSLSTIETKQDILVSGTTIKTINGESVLGTGDLNLTRQFMLKIARAGLNTTINTGVDFNIISLIGISGNVVASYGKVFADFGILNQGAANATLKMPVIDKYVDLFFSLRLIGTIAGAGTREFYVDLRRFDDSVVDGYNSIKTSLSTIDKRSSPISTYSFNATDNFITNGIKLVIVNPSSGSGNITLTGFEILIKGTY